MFSILLVHQTQLICESIAAALGAEKDMGHIDSATAAAPALALAADRGYDLVLISTGLTEGRPLALIRDLGELAVPPKVLVLGAAPQEALLLPYLEAGAAGYVLQDSTTEEMLSRLRAALRGEAVVSGAMAGTLIRRVAQLAGELARLQIDPAAYHKLTPREREVLDLIGEGRTNLEIGAALTIELGTVKNHVHNLLRKLNVSTRREAAAVLAQQTGGPGESRNPLTASG